MTTEQELALIKQAFADNDELLKGIRALFLGLGVTESEKDVIRSVFKSDDMRKVMWNRFLPQLKKDTQIGVINDVWMGAEKNIFGQTRDTIYQTVQYKALAVEMLEQALGLLENPDGQAPSIEFIPNQHITDELQIFLLARNMFLQSVENQLSYLKVIANMKEDETPEQAQKRVLADSSK